MRNGVVLALIACAIYAAGDGFFKSLGGGDLSVFEIGFFSILFTGIFLLFLTPQGERWHGFWRVQRPWAVHAFALTGVAANALCVFAFTTIPLAEAYALMFLSPIFITLLSIATLGERVGVWRWAAVVAGFIGILLVVRPGFRGLEWGHLAALGVAFLVATSITLMRSLAKERQTSMLGLLVSYSLLFNGIAMLATSVTLPDLRALCFLALAGASTAIGRRLQLEAARLSPANQTAPALYTQIVWAVLIGAVFFAEYPDWIALIGLVVVTGSGLLTLVRERIKLGVVLWRQA